MKDIYYLQTFLACLVQNVYHEPGPFTRSCRECQCHANGSWNCKKKCNFPTHVTCRENEAIKKTSIETIKGCFCDKLECVRKSNPRGGKFFSLTYNFVDFGVTLPFLVLFLHKRASWTLYPFCWKNKQKW